MSRHDWAGYLDVEVTPVRGLLLQAAGRAEEYSDFGSTLDGKLAVRIEPVAGFALRGAVGTGFRAPSLGQSYFSSTATNFLVINGVNTPGLGEVLFGRVERGRIERGQPRNRLNLSLAYTLDRLAVNLNNRRFGEVSVFGTGAVGSATNADPTFGARWITDLDVGYRVTDRFTVAAEANNLLGVYPEQNFRSPTGADNSNAGIFPYNQVSPFGFNGAFYYLRVSWNGM